jgi:hypothetical protein
MAMIDGRLSQVPERASWKARSTVVGRSGAMSAHSRGVEPKAAIAAGVAEMDLPLRPRPRPGGQPPRARFELGVIADVGAFAAGFHDLSPDGKREHFVSLSLEACGHDPVMGCA